jgi:hypothetical protein
LALYLTRLFSSLLSLLPRNKVVETLEDVAISNLQHVLRWYENGPGGKRLA